MFSVLMSVYWKDSPQYFREALESVFDQTLMPQEVVLVKDGALNGGLDQIVEEFVQTYPSTIKVIALERNHGLGYALGVGMQSCSFEFVARVDSDDICFPDRFETQVAILKANPQIDILGAWIDEFEGNKENVLSIRKVPEDNAEILAFSKYRCPFNHPSVMLRKSSVLKCGNYQPYGTFEDYLLWMKMLKQGCVGYNVQRSLVYFRTSRQVYARRGGLKKAVAEVRLQLKFYELGAISLLVLARNIVVRGVFRIVPSTVRGFLYKYFGN